MSRTLRVTVDAATVSTASAIAAAARHVPLLVLTGRSFSDLAAELGSHDAAARHLSRIASRTGKPIGMNMETADGSRTLFLAPKDWSTERLTGWVAGHHQDLEEAFGPAAILEAAS